MEREMMPEIEITPGSGNVFADLGLPNPEVYELKARLVSQIQQFIRDKGWNQTQAADVLGLDQPKVSKLLRGRLSEFSVERLLTMLNRLGHDVEVRISAEEHAPEESHLLVMVA